MEQKRKSQKERWSINRVVLVHRCENCDLCLGVWIPRYICQGDIIYILPNSAHTDRDDGVEVAEASDDNDEHTVRNLKIL